jgi:riboflavin transporter FmnP
MIKLSLLEKKYDAFVDENGNAIDYVHDKITEVVEAIRPILYSGDKFVENLEKLRETNDTIKLGITEANVKSIKDMLSSKKLKFGSGMWVLSSIENAKLNIYGKIVLGDASRSTLSSDILTFSSNSGFDIDRHVEVSLFTKNGGFSIGMCVNISTILIRAISKYLVSDEKTLADIGHLIQLIMLQKWVKYIEASFAILHNIKHYAPSVMPMLGMGSTNPNTSLVDYLKALFIFKVYYNIVNHIEGTIYSQNVDKLMNLIDNMCMSYSVLGGVERACNVLYNVVSNGYLELRRDIDEVIDNAIELYRKSIRMTVPGAIPHTVNTLTSINRNAISNFVVNKKHLMGVEAVYDVAPNIIAHIQDGMESLEDNDNMPSIISVVGMENIKDFSKHETINAGTRAKILSKFNNKERKTYIKYENDVMRITAKVNNCTSTFSQSAIISDIESISTCINVDINRSENDNFRLLMQLLDSELRRAGQMVANRNFAKERKTMLYGNIKTLSNWDF